MLVIPAVCHLELSKWHIADGAVKEAVRQICLFKALHRNAGFLIQLLGDPSGNAVQFHTVDTGVGHDFRKKPHEISDAAGWLQDIASAEIHIGKGLIHGTNDHRRRIKSRQSGFSGGCVFLVGQKGFQLCVLTVTFIKAICQTAPAYILGKHLLFFRCSKAVFVLQSFQKPDGSYIIAVPLSGSSHTQVIPDNRKVMSVGIGDFRVDNKGGGFRFRQHHLRLQRLQYFHCGRFCLCCDFLLLFLKLEFRKANHFIKVQIGKVLIQVRQIYTLHRCHRFVIHQIE